LKYFHINNIKFNYDLEFKNNLDNDFWKQNTPLIDYCETLGVNIPHYCYHKNLSIFSTITVEDILILKWYFLFLYMVIVLFDKFQSINLDDENVIRHIFDLKRRDPNRPRYTWAEIEERMRRGEILVPAPVLTGGNWLTIPERAAPVPPVPAAPVPAGPVPVPPVPAAPVPAGPVPVPPVPASPVSVADAAGTEAASQGWNNVPGAGWRN